MTRLPAAVACVFFSAAVAAKPAADDAAFRALYKQLVEINTTLSVGSCTEAAKAMQARLIAGGFAEADATVLVPADRPKDGNLIATLEGADANASPILLLAHFDVVEAKRADWKRDPFKLTEEGGFFYARGASDDKAMAAVFTDTLIRYRKEGFKPRRTLRLALTCGEETSDTFDGVSWLIGKHPNLMKAAFALNEGAGGELDAQGRAVALQIQAGEKVYQDFRLEVTDRGGHSSRPTRVNPIYSLSAALGRIGAFQFPIALNDATRAYFKGQLELAPTDVAEDIKGVLRDPPDGAAADRLWTLNPAWNGMLRTTCVATMVDAGHAPNALPQRAGANVNCRILPGTPLAAVKETLARLADDPTISIKAIGEPSPTGNVPTLGPEMMEPLRKVAEAIWPGVAIVPTMSTGATDGRFLNAFGTPTYGLSGMFHDAEGSHAHGLDERIRVRSLLDGRTFLYEVVKLYANAVD
ncbi:MAG: M20/M25/M40 family metallo-hydrolase [Dokdonella sp.]|uniref:M20/M25/M40 family metallo-hydrolase n=1 Tax=Dokdonella sp. TaxID=2291710 RepID=UPI003267983B